MFSSFTEDLTDLFVRSETNQIDRKSFCRITIVYRIKIKTTLSIFLPLIVTLITLDLTGLNQTRARVSLLKEMWFYFFNRVLIHLIVVNMLVCRRERRTPSPIRRYHHPSHHNYHHGHHPHEIGFSDTVSNVVEIVKQEHRRQPRGKNIII